MRKLMIMIIVAMVFHASNVSAQWSLVYNVGSSGMDVLNKDTIFAIGGYHVVRSVDGGASWSDLFTIPYSHGPITFPNDTTGYLSSYGKVFKTIDFGNTWTVVKSDSTWFTNLSFPTADIGLVVSEGIKDTLFRTSNGGQSWNPVFIRQYIQNVQLVDENVGYLTHDSLFKTIDGGLTWNFVNIDTLFIPGLSLISAVKFFNADTGLIRIDGNILMTKNGGTTWDLICSVILPNYYTCSFYSKDALHIYYCGWDGLASFGGIYYSDNGGSSWIWLKSGNFFELEMYNDSIGYAATIDEGIYKTTNGGFTDPDAIQEPLTKNKNDFEIYPNPVTDNLNIRNSEPMAKGYLNVYDALGKSILCQKLSDNANTSISFKAFPDGIYFYSVIDNAKILHSGKFVKIKNY